MGTYFARQDGFAYASVSSDWYDESDCWYLLSISELTPTVFGAITDASTGDPLSVEVTAYRSDGAGSYFYYTNTYAQSDGSYGFIGLPDGEYKLNFFDYEFGLGEWWDNAALIEDATPITVTAGTTQRADASMDRPTPSLAGRITDELTGDPITNGAAAYIYRLSSRGNWNYYDWVYAQDNGRWKAYGLPAGTYRVVSEGWAESRLLLRGLG